MFDFESRIEYMFVYKRVSKNVYIHLWC